MVYFVAASYTSSSVLRVDISIMLSQSSRPARIATARTVSGLSPDMTFTVTPSCLKNLKVSGASALILSVI